MAGILLSRPGGRRRHFLTLVAISSGAIVASELLAAALFLDVAGAGGLPLYFILIAVTAPIASLLVVRLSERLGYARTVAILSLALGAVTLVAAGVPAMPIWLAYGVYLAVGVLQLVLIAVGGLLISEHFTIIEGRRIGSAVATFTALGSSAGAFSVAIAVALLSPSAGFIIAALAAAVAGGLALSFDRQHPALARAAEADEDPKQSQKLRSGISRILMNDRLSRLIAGGAVLAIVLQCMLEWLAYGIYVEKFPQFSDLAGFMAIVVGCLHLFALGLGATTGRLVFRSGVAAAHLAYPCCAVFSFAFVGAAATLPAALLAHVASDPLERSMNEPVTNLLYNALAPETAHRLRLFVGGAVASFGIGFAGLTLLTLDPLLTSSQIGFAGAVLALVLCAVHFEAGRSYRNAIRTSMCEGLLSLDEATSSNHRTSAKDADVSPCERDGLLLERLSDLGALSNGFARRYPFCALAINDFRHRVGQSLIDHLATSPGPADMQGFRLLHAVGDVRERARAIEAASLFADGYSSRWLRLALDDDNLSAAKEASDELILRLLGESGDRWLTAAAEFAAGRPGRHPTGDLADLAFLKSTAPFSELLLDDLAKLRSAMGTRRLSLGEYLIRAGDEGASMYVVRQGEVRICSPGSSGAELLHLARTGDVIGEMALIDAAPRSADAIATIPTLLLRLDRIAFLDLAMSRPTVLLGLSRLLARRLRPPSPSATGDTM